MKPADKELFKAFLADFDEERKDRIWEEHSASFRNFWNERIMKGSAELEDVEIDKIVQILDRNGKGNTKQSEAVARTMVVQGVWRRMFREIKQKEKLRSLINQIFEEKVNAKKIELIDKLYELNKDQKNNLTGGSGNVINAMLFAYSPKDFTSVISMKDRSKVIDYFEFEKVKEAIDGTPGQRFVLSNASIVGGFRKLGLNNSIRTISSFLYSSPFKDSWKIETKTSPLQKTASVSELEEELEDSPKVDVSRFSMESELENFLITNWENTELGKRYDLLVEDGELVSQQYQTGIGRIDILAEEKKTKKLVVIELKKGRTSDDTVGQLTRYMGWLEEHKTKGEETKGIIIALEYDDKLYYAAKKIKDVEVYIYKISFSLEAHKRK